MPNTMESLSLDQVRKLVLHAQQLPTTIPQASAIATTQSVIQHLGYIQIDTISAIERAHHHTLWNRNPHYLPSHLDELVATKQVFEYWSHAAAYLPMTSYRYTLPRKQYIRSGQEKYWQQCSDRLLQMVYSRIEQEGPLMAKDFEPNRVKSAEWTAKPAKQALEYLFMQGKLMVVQRNKFHKVYDITARVLPDEIDTSIPSPEEYARFLITQYLKANGLGLAGEIAYLLKNTKPLVSTTLKEMTLSGELQEIKVNNILYHTLPSSLQLLNKPLARNQLKILSPFDNLLIQRKRMVQLFNYDYTIECYVPEAKRQYGYFSLPILWDDKLVARMDCKAERKEGILHINHLALEPSLTKKEDFALALKQELIPFMAFNNCKRLQLHKTSPSNFKNELKDMVKELNH